MEASVVIRRKGKHVERDEIVVMTSRDGIDRVIGALDNAGMARGPLEVRTGDGHAGARVFLTFAGVTGEEAATAVKTALRRAKIRISRFGD